MPSAAGASAALLFPDPYSFPADRALADLALTAPGRAGARRHLERAHARRRGCALPRRRGRHAAAPSAPCCTASRSSRASRRARRAIGPVLEISAVDGHVIRELDGRPALVTLREAIEGLSQDERELVERRAAARRRDRRRPHARRARTTTSCGASSAPTPKAGTITVGAPVREGQVVRLHARDAGSADHDLRSAPRAAQLGARRQRRGRARLHLQRARPEHVRRRPTTTPTPSTRSSAARPCAGFFAAGEIGPVGGENFLHGFTATVAVFAGGA